MRRSDPYRALLRALAERYPALVVDSGGSEPWASATFTGARHVLRGRGADLNGIEDDEFDLPGHFVADIAWTKDGDGLRIEALTIEAA